LAAAAFAFTLNEVSIKKMQCPLEVDGEFFFLDWGNFERGGVKGMLPVGCLPL